MNFLKKRKRNMYDVTEYRYGQPIPVEVEVSFSLPYHDWCRFETSDAWIRAISLLEDFQRERRKKLKRGTTVE